MFGSRGSSLDGGASTSSLDRDSMGSLDGGSMDDADAPPSAAGAEAPSASAGSGSGSDAPAAGAPPREQLPPGYSDADDACEEARLAAEDIVLPLAQPVELLPRGEGARAAQANLLSSYGLSHEVVGDGSRARLRVVPAGWADSSSSSSSGSAGGSGELQSVAQQQ